MCKRTRRKCDWKDNEINEQWEGQVVLIMRTKRWKGERKQWYEEQDVKRRGGEAIYFLMVYLTTLSAYVKGTGFGVTSSTI